MVIFYIFSFRLRGLCSEFVVRKWGVKTWVLRYISLFSPLRRRKTCPTLNCCRWNPDKPARRGLQNASCCLKTHPPFLFLSVCGCVVVWCGVMWCEDDVHVTITLMSCCVFSVSAQSSWILCKTDCTSITSLAFIKIPWQNKIDFFWNFDKVQFQFAGVSFRWCKSVKPLRGRDVQKSS